MGIRPGPNGPRGEFETGQYLDGGDQKSDADGGDENRGVPRDRRAARRQRHHQHRRQREERIESGLEMSGEDQQAGDQASEQSVAQCAGLDGAQGGP